MIDDPFESMANSLARFADDVRALIDVNSGRPAQGSPAAAECESDPFQGEWGNHPTRAAVGALMLSATACLDHLRAASILIRSRAVTFSPHTVVRAASEAAAVGCYLVDPAIDQRERVRRGANARLSGLCQERLTLEQFADSRSETAEKVAGIDQTLGRFERAATLHGFSYVPPKGRRSAYLDEETPGATTLLSWYMFPRAPKVGIVYQRGLSSVAHTELHGLLRKMMPNGAGGLQVNATAETIALELLAGPLAASTLVEWMVPWLGWDRTALDASVPELLEVWGRIGNAPYPGPELAAS